MGRDERVVGTLLLPAAVRLDFDMQGRPDGIDLELDLGTVAEAEVEVAAGVRPEGDWTLGGVGRLGTTRGRATAARADIRLSQEREEVTCQRRPSRRAMRKRRPGQDCQAEACRSEHAAGGIAPALQAAQGSRPWRRTQVAPRAA